MRELTRNLLCAAILALALSATATNASAQLGDPDLTTMTTLRDQYGWGAVFGWQTGSNNCGPYAPCSDNPCPIGASSWPGVSCDLGRVVVLNLVCGATQLNAPIPPILGQLTGLTSMDIRGCGLTGAIPDLSSLNMLTRIRFNDNLLTGSVPDYLAAFTTLGVLDLTNNLLTGTLPNFTLNSKAIVLRFGGNLLTDSPTAWAQQNTTSSSVYTDVSYNCWQAPPVAICNPQSPSTNVCTPNRQDCPAAVTLTKVSGDGQRTQVNASFLSPLVVSVTDLSGNPVVGATVTFSGPGIVTATALTDGSGLVSEMVQANSTVGGNTVTAAVNPNEMVTFGLTAGTATTCGTDIVVTSNLDSGPSTLRQALADVCPGGTVDLSGIAGQTIALSSGATSYNFNGRLYIATDVTILGGGVTISGSGATRIFFVQGGNITLTNLTLANGLGQGGTSNFGGSAAGLGGAIFQNGGNLTLSGVTLSGNQAVGGTQDSSGNAAGGGFGAGSSGGDLGGTAGLGDGAGGVSDILGGTGGFGAGGGSATATLGTGVIYNGGAGGFGGGSGWAINVAASSTGASPSVFSGSPGFGGGLEAPEIAGTPVGSGGGSGAGFGGAIFVRAGSLNLTGVSFTGSSAVGGTGAQGKGGALFLYSGANLNMIPNLTFTGSVAANAGAPGQGVSNPPYTNGATCPGEDTVDVCGTLPINTLTVTVSGNGSVTDSTGLINCPAGSCSALFQTSAVLTPAAPIGYVFSGWSGGCSGLGACTVSLAAGSVSVLANFVTGAPQAITFNTIPPQLVGTPLTLGATASSGLAVTYSSTTTAVCTVSGSTATFLAPGSCSITASQPGSSTYAAASPVTLNFSVLSPQTITFNTIPAQLVGTPLTLTATATSGLTVSYSSTTTTVCAVSGSTATFLASGPCSITASQSGNSTYAAASSVTQGFTVLSPQTITFSAIPAQVVGTPLTLTATASSGLTVSYLSTTTTVCTVSGSTATFLAPGPCSITASQPGNSAYAAAISVTQGFTVQLAQFMLTTAANPASGGTVTPPSGSYAANTVVSLTAKPSAGYVFSNWTGNVANPSSASTTVTMTGAQNVTANFSAVSTLTVAPSSIDFGTLYLGDIAIRDVTLTNTGTTPITVTDPLLSIVQGGNSSEFVQLNLCPKSLAAGSHCTITIAFVAGPFYTPQTATLSIADNAPGNPQTVMLTATVIDPQPSFNAASLSFGTQAVATSTTKTVTLKNVGATTLLLTGMAVTGRNASAFTLTPASNCGSSLTAGSSCTISVTFMPVAKGSYTAALNVTDNAPSGTQGVILSGDGR